MVLTPDAGPSLSAPPVGVERADTRSYRRLAGTDIDQAMAFFTSDYELKAPAIRRTHADTAWDFAGVTDERMSLRTSRFGVDLRSQSQSDDFIVAWLRSGSSTITFNGRSVDLEPGVPVVLPSETYDLHHRDIGLNLVHLDRSFVTSLVGDDTFSFEPLERPAVDGMGVWRDTVRRLSSTWLQVDAPLTATVRRDIAEAFANAALRAFPRRSTWRAAVTGSGPEHQRLRRALDYVQAHAREPIGTPEIAAAAGLSPRGLQQSLRRHLDQTPGELLRSVRLDGALDELRRAERDETSVADIARGWGFGHLGRFSAAYRSRFGELPSDTLRTRTRR
jgi:AraC-like DNA-binding protein